MGLVPPKVVLRTPGSRACKSMPSRTRQPFPHGHSRIGYGLDNLPEYQLKDFAVATIGDKQQPDLNDFLRAVIPGSGQHRPEPLNLFRNQ